MTRVDVLRRAGTYEILTPREWLARQPMIIERAGRTCYQSGRDKPITPETATRFCRMLIARGHESVLEHSSLTVRFDNHSRGFTHELVRHRLASFSQESTRYVDYELARHGAKVVIPPDAADDFADKARCALDSYSAMREECYRAEDARQLLPIGLKSEIVITANLREWRHIFSMRCAKPAHWEIRRTMVMLLEEMIALLPGIFGDFVHCGEHRGSPYFLRRMPKAALLQQIVLAELK